MTANDTVDLLHPDAGSIRVAGTDATEDPAAARTCVALQTQGEAPLDGLTARRRTVGVVVLGWALAVVPLFPDVTTFGDPVVFSVTILSTVAGWGS